ncbi:MAG: hypothetical protein N2Z79_00145, partial [Candidatus Omnitrophica bacterium]|nr:hypothetical protein [Candidatus Omnitrophota bacterium]
VNGEEGWCNVNKDWDKVIWVPGTFVQSKTFVSNLSHNPSKPPTFTERGIPNAPTVAELISILPRYEVYLERWVALRGESGRLTDEKLRIIWRWAKDANLDPFLFLAILAQEGTGSFNTKSSPYGGQPHDDFELDMRNAVGVIKREIEEWRNNGCKGDWLRWVNYGNGGNVYTDGYAEDLSWWIKVIKIYDGERLRIAQR